jgi:hypothetical protein
MELSKFQRAKEIREEITTLENKINSLIKSSSEMKYNKESSIVVALKDEGHRGYRSYESESRYITLMALSQPEINLLIAHYEIQLEDAQERFKEI